MMRGNVGQPKSEADAMRDRASGSRHPRSIGITLLGVMAGLIFLVSLAVHFATFAPNPMISMDWTWPIHLAIFIPFGGMVLILAYQRQKTKKSVKQFLEQTNEQINEDFDRQAHILERIVRSVPPPILLVGVALLFYTVVNFVLFMGLMGGGSPVQDSGRYYLSNHGTYTRELTQDEYHQYQAYEVRGFSGHWLIFSFVPFAYCVFIHRRTRDVEAPDPVR
jgi:hypothetical protein